MSNLKMLLLKGALMTKFVNTKLFVALRLLGPHPNTYTFTKRLSEQIASDMDDKIPIIIARPSIVMPSLCEPIGGWVDSFYGATGICIAIAKGIVKVIFVDAEQLTEIIPVDVAVNVAICCGYERAKNDYSNTPVVNVTNNGKYPFTWTTAIKEGINACNKYPYRHVLWYPESFFTKSPYIFVISSLLLQIIPSLVVDFLLIMFLQKPFLFTTQKRLLLTGITLQKFAAEKWLFSDTNCVKIEEGLHEADKEIFYGVTSKDMNMKEYITNFYLTSKKYLVKDTSENFEVYRFRTKILFLLNILLKLSFMYMVFKWSFICIQKVL